MGAHPMLQLGLPENNVCYFDGLGLTGPLESNVATSPTDQRYATSPGRMLSAGAQRHVVF